MKMISKTGLLSCLVVLSQFAGASTAGVELQQSEFEKGLTRIKTEYALYSNLSDKVDVEVKGNVVEKPQEGVVKLKSPNKAFALSLLMPGLGQYYYGSRTKPFAFLGVEVTAWVLYFKWKGDGNDLTDEFEAIADAHWIEADYVSYLQTVYGANDDENITATEVSHRLPDTRTQQYYEMIGKYDQFSWGWDDAVLGGSSVPVGAVLDESTLPFSARRNNYEIMRNEANKRYKRADAMIAVSLFNRLISGFEAYFVTRSRNNAIRHDRGSFGGVKIKADLRSYTSIYDTPYLNVSYSF